jgi:hypothetical protein
LIKSKFRSSLDRLKKLLFNKNKWRPVPPVNDDEFFVSSSDDEYNESESQSLMASHSALPTGFTPSVKIKTKPVAVVSYGNDNKIKRVTKELIDDEIPLIKI